MFLIANSRVSVSTDAGVGAHPVAQTQQAGVQRGLGLAQQACRRPARAESTTVPDGSTSTIDSSVR